MAVAKSYEGYEIISEPYEKNGKPYVTILGNCPRCGGSGHYSYNQMDGTMCLQCRGAKKVKLSVRWYTDAERQRMDRATETRRAKVIQERIAREEYANGPQGNGFGTAEGSITIILGDSYDVKDELKAGGCKYNPALGWYIPNGVNYIVPAEYGLRTHILTWAEASEDGRIKSAPDLRKIVSRILYGESHSEYQGEIGEKLSVDVKVIGSYAMSGRFGGYCFRFIDQNGNEYSWLTNSTYIEKGTSCSITGKVKDHEEYNGVKRTILTRCKITNEH